MSKPRADWAVYAGLAALVLVVYGPAFGAPFVIDDLGFVRDNPAFGLPWGEFLRGLAGRDYFRMTGERTYQPLVTLLHYFIHASPFLCRAASALIHAINAALVFRLCRRLAFDERSSLLAAVLFAVFPASVEAVNIAAFKGHLLAFTFSAAALLAWSGPWCVPLYGLALLSKETSVIVPVFALAHFFFSSQADRRRLLLPLGALASMTGAYLVFRFLALRPLPIPFAAPENLHPWLNLSWYARLLLWPSPLCLAHAAPLNISPFLGLLPLAFAGIAWFLRKRPALLACAAWILIALLPFLQIIPVENINPVADRYLYMACAGFCALAAAALPKPLAFALALAWGALACVRNEQFRAPAALYEQTVACAPDAPQAHSLLGDYRMSSGDWPGAEESYSKALALDPRSPDALENIGAVQFQRGDRSAARLSLERAAAAEPASARVQYNLGALFAVQKDKTRAADYFRRALTLDPDYAPARRALDELQK